MDWELTVGRVRTSDNSVYVMHDTDDFFAIEVDLNTKYATPFGYSSDDNSVDFYLGVSDHTLNADPDETKGFTSLTVHHKSNDAEFINWSFMHEVSRYTWRIVGYHDPYTD